MKSLLRKELWRILLVFCMLTAAAAALWPYMTGSALPLGIPAALALWSLLLGMSRRPGAWGPAVLCLLALFVDILLLTHALREDIRNLPSLLMRPVFLPTLLILASLLLSYVPDLFAIRALAALIWTGAWLAASLFGPDLPKLTILAMLPLPLLAGCEAFFRLLRRGKAKDFAALRGGLCLVFAAAALLTAAVPTPAEPYGYPRLRAVIRKAETLWSDLAGRIGRREGDLEFGLDFNGTGGQPKAGEAAPGASAGSLLLQPRMTTAGPLYLFANAWDHFDGRSWSQEESQKKESALLWNADTLEHVYALWRWQQAHGKEDDERFLRANDLLIRYRNMETRTMFSAENALHFFHNERRDPVTAEAGGIRFDYMQKDGAEYRMYWLESNTQTIDQLIAYSEGYVYESSRREIWATLMERYERRFHLDMRKAEVLEALLAQRQEMIRSRDLGTEGVSARAAALAEEITADCGTSFEKLQAIASYLQENYRYTLSPKPVPDGENFLDWLLFETGEGYCTWFATAATLLARSAGIPARFVQGYRADSLPLLRYTALDAEAAHAWCEGYIQGYGWVTVEATPGFAARGYGWIPQGETTRAELPDDPLLLHEKGEKHDTAGRKTAEDGAQTNDLTAGAAEGEEAKTTPRRRLFLALIPLGAIAGLAAYRLLQRWKRRRYYLQSPPQEQVRQDLERLLGYLRRRGYSRAAEESVSAFFASLSWRLLPVEEEEALAMAEFYERVLFGGHVPSQEEMDTQRAFVDAIRPKRRRLF